MLALTKVKHISVNELVFVLLLLICCVSLVFCASASIHGNVEFDHITYQKNSNGALINSRNRTGLELELKSEMASNTSFYSVVYGRVDNSAGNSAYIDIHELELRYSLWKFDFILGKQLIRWGSVDALNPLSISALDLSDFLASEDIPEPALRTKFYIADASLEMVIYPTFMPHEFPDGRSRWSMESSLPREQKKQLMTLYGAKDANIIIQDPLAPNVTANHPQYGFKLNAMMLGVDFSACYYSGYARGPTYFNGGIAYDSIVHVMMIPKYLREQMIGTDFATILWGIGIRGEGGLFLTKDMKKDNPSIDDPYIRYAISADKMFTSIPWGQNVNIILEWLSDESLTPDEKNRSFANHLFEKTIIGQVVFKANNLFQVNSQIVFNVENKDRFIQVGTFFDINDAMKVDFKVDLLQGKAGTLFGTYAKNDRLHVLAQYYF